jgi:flagellar biosynthesis regulator FlaF
MSWTIEKTDRNGDGIAELNRAIEAAAEQNILMFCAATDQGAVKDQSYPAASYTKRIFKIGAASASGATRKSVGDPTAVDFIFPGHQVITEEPGDSRVTEYTAHTGSSVATALAAGLAAQMLYCVQLGAIHRDRDNPDLSKFWELKNHERMEKAMLRIGATSEKYLRVWERFSTKVKKADNEFAHKLKWIEYVTELADELMWT